MGEIDARQKTGTELAFLGDAVYELLVREYLAQHMHAGANALHHAAVGFVCAAAQSRALAYIQNQLDAEELDIVRRGRNANKVAIPKNAAPRDYRCATALESLFGYLYLCGREMRMRELFNTIVTACAGEAEADNLAKKKAAF